MSDYNMATETAAAEPWNKGYVWHFKFYLLAMWNFIFIQAKKIRENIRLAILL